MVIGDLTPEISGFQDFESFIRGTQPEEQPIFLTFIVGEPVPIIMKMKIDVARYSSRKICAR